MLPLPLRLLAPLALLLAPLAAAAADLVANGDFQRFSQNWQINEKPPSVRIDSRFASPPPSSAGQALRLEVRVEPGAQPWDGTLQQPLAPALALGQHVRISLWARSPGGEFPLGLGVQDRNYDKACFFFRRIGPEWTRHTWRMPALKAVAAGSASLAFHLAHGGGALELHGVSVEFEPLSDRPAPGASYLINGDFAAGLDNWETTDNGATRVEPAPVPGPGRDIARAMRLDVTVAPGAKPWDTQLRQIVGYPVFKGDEALLVFHARAATEGAELTLVLEGPGAAKALLQRVRLGTAWKRHEIPVRFAHDIERGRARFALHLAKQPGAIELAALDLAPLPAP